MLTDDTHLLEAYRLFQRVLSHGLDEGRPMSKQEKKADQLTQDIGTWLRKEGARKAC